MLGVPIRGALDECRHTVPERGKNGAKMSETPKPWVKFYNADKTPESLKYPDESLYSVARTTATRYPDRIAYEFEGKTERCVFA